MRPESTRGPADVIDGYPKTTGPVIARHRVRAITALVLVAGVVAAIKVALYE